MTRASKPFSCCSGPTMTTDAGAAASDEITYPCGGGLVTRMVTGVEIELRVSRLAVTLVGGSMSSTFESALVIVIGT